MNKEKKETGTKCPKCKKEKISATVSKEFISTSASINPKDSPFVYVNVGIITLSCPACGVLSIKETSVLAAELEASGSDPELLEMLQTHKVLVMEMPEN